MTGGSSRAFAAARIAARFGLFAFFCVAGVFAQEPAPQQAPPIRVSVDRVNVGVIVTDAQQRFVEGLRRDDFELLDDGAPQPLTGFLSIEEPAQIVLMIECGPAVYFFRNDLVLAADALLTRLSPADRVAVVCYTRTAELRLDFTADKTAARIVLRDLNFASGYGDLNLSASLSSVLDSLRRVAGKKTIVLVTSGVDTSAPADAKALKEKLSASEVRILAVSTSEQIQAQPKKQKLSRQQRDDHSEVKKILAEAAVSLGELSRITGGRVYTPKTSRDFDRAYAEIAELVRHEYDLEFAPPAHDGKAHTIEVRVKGHAYSVSHREEYLAPMGSDQ